MFLTSCALHLAMMGLQSTDGLKKNPEDLSAWVSQAVKLAVKTYADSGISGLIAESTSCHEKDLSNLQGCIALDLAARNIDDRMREVYKFPAEEYFSDANLSERTVKIYSALGFSDEEAAERFIVIRNIVRRLVPILLDEEVKKR